MRAQKVVDLTGSKGALRLAEVPEPQPAHLTPGSGVVVEVHAAGVSSSE